MFARRLGSACACLSISACSASAPSSSERVAHVDRADLPLEHANPAELARFREGDAFLFGGETAGLPDAMLDRFPPERRIRLPMRPGNRSLNLSNAVAVVVFEAWRQLGYAGGG